MERRIIIPRPDWQAKVEDLGFGFHSVDGKYWDESAYYKFTLAEITRIEQATATLWGMCKEAVQYVIDNKLYHKFAIPAEFIPMIETSWRKDAPAIYGRYDFGYNGKDLKMFEFNADTPTSLFEAGVVQWKWFEETQLGDDQFNSIHDKLVHYWRYLKKYLKPVANGLPRLYLSCETGNLEDLTTVAYMQDCAEQAGISTELIFVDEIGWDHDPGVNCFVDTDNQPIKNIFKLYPWEHLIREGFAEQFATDSSTYWIEPPWKMILSNKAILPILWKLFPDCPYILEAYFEEENRLTDYVKKPLLSREGANITVVRNGTPEISTEGEYGEEGYICQQLFELPSYGGQRPIIGSWVIGQVPAGMGIREDSSLITGNGSHFMPHVIIG